MSTSNKLLTIGGFFAFFAFGLTDNLKGPLLPEILRSGELNYSQGGAIVFAGYIGFIFATLTSGLIADKFSNRSVMLLAAICLCIGAVGFGTASSYVGLIVFMAISGIGLGAIELGANGLMVELHNEARGRYLNLLATFHGCGSLVAPLYVAAMIGSGRSWQWIYGSSVVLAVPLIAIFWPRNIPIAEKPVPISPQNHAENSWRQIWQVGFTPQMCCYYVLIAAYVAVELSVAAWMMQFLQQSRGMTVAVSSIYLSSFFVLLMLGRLFGSFVVDRFEPLRIVFFAIAASGICLAVGLFGSEQLVFLLPASAFFMSIVFPTVTAAVTRLHEHNTGTILGLLFASGGLGGALGPWTVGLLSDAFSLQYGLSASLVFALIALAAIALLQRLAKGFSPAV